jgi:hypothetical protein
MLKKTWLKWGLILTGSTVAVLNLGGCLADFILQQVILTWAN